MFDNKFGRWLDKLAGVSEPWQDEEDRAKLSEGYYAAMQTVGELYPNEEQLAARAAYFRREPGKLGLAMTELVDCDEPRHT